MNLPSSGSTGLLNALRLGRENLADETLAAVSGSIGIVQDSIEGRYGRIVGVV